ncbi:MAG: rod shape-determining protein MreC, partial [Cyanobacteria bacterium J083]
MFAVRRWWERYGRKIGFFTCALLTAIILRQTQGAAILEVYYFISKPFQSKEKELILNKLR